MKKNTHPKYQQVLFIDSTTGHKFICGSTLKTDETETYEGKTFPVYRAATSSASHPFFTGSKQLVDAEGRVEKFKKRYAAQPKKEESEGQKEEKASPKEGKAKKKK